MGKYGHIDTKLENQIFEQKNISVTNDRLGLSVSSLDAQGSEDMLGVYIIENSKGDVQTTEIYNILQYFNYVDQGLQLMQIQPVAILVNTMEQLLLLPILFSAGVIYMNSTLNIS